MPCDQLISRIAQENVTAACACAADKPSPPSRWALWPAHLAHYLREWHSSLSMRSWSTIRPSRLRPVWPAHFPHCAREWHGSLRMRSWSAFPIRPMTSTLCAREWHSCLRMRSGQLYPPLGYALCDQLISHTAQENGKVACACAADQSSAHPGLRPVWPAHFPHCARERHSTGSLRMHNTTIRPCPHPDTPCVTSSFRTLRKRMAH